MFGLVMDWQQLWAAILSQGPSFAGLITFRSSMQGPRTNLHQVDPCTKRTPKMRKQALHVVYSLVKHRSVNKSLSISVVRLCPTIISKHDDCKTVSEQLSRPFGFHEL